MDPDPKWARIVLEANDIESNCRIGQGKGNFNWLMEGTSLPAAVGSATHWPWDSVRGRLRIRI